MDKKRIFQHVIADSSSHLGKQYRRSRLILHLNEEICEYLTANTRHDNRYVELIAVVDFCRLTSVNEVYKAIKTHDIDGRLAYMMIGDIIDLIVGDVWMTAYHERKTSWLKKGYTENINRSEFCSLGLSLVKRLTKYISSQCISND